MKEGDFCAFQVEYGIVGWLLRGETANYEMWSWILFLKLRELLEPEVPYLWYRDKIYPP